MENTTPFDLNEAIRRWQEELNASPALSAENHEELETHLRASVQRLQGTGLSEEEAFLIAARRLGNHGLLEQEFAKVNAGTVWLTRGIWMVVGILVARTCESVADAAASVTLFCTQHILANGVACGVLTTMSGLVAEGLLIVMLYRLAVHKQKTLTQWFHRSLNWPLLTSLGLVLLMSAVNILLGASLQLGFHSVRPQMMSSLSFVRLAGFIFLPIALVLLARRRQKSLTAMTFSP